VTLSACETGVGKQRRGEGIISLARAFTFAGAKSIVTSLWAVSDEQTKNLMLYFYEGMKTGLSKSEALRQSKLKLAHASGGHPYFWAGFVGIGDMR
jgi:CHAT domain-containing protein